MASVASWTFILGWWGQLVVGAMDTLSPQDLKGHILEGPGVEDLGGVPVTRGFLPH